MYILVSIRSTDLAAASLASGDRSPMSLSPSLMFTPYTNKVWLCQSHVFSVPAGPTLIPSGLSTSSLVEMQCKSCVARVVTGPRHHIGDPDKDPNRPSPHW